MLAQLLKEQTRAEHAALEKKLIGQIKAVRSEAQYARLLGILYGYYASLESRLHFVLNEGNFPGFQARRKSHCIIDDLTVLCSQVDALPLCHELPTVDTFAKAIGAMYVLEGSTLGGQYIAKMLTDQCSFPVQRALSFFHGYGNDTMAKWEEFKTYLASLESFDHRSEACEAATQTFFNFQKWIDQHDKN